jgi:hypothetical protein
VLDTYEQQNGAGWYPQRPKKGRNGYDTTGRPKGLAILKKAEIEETDTRGTQVEEDYSDSTWIALDSDADPEDVDDWEVDMGLKTRYEHPENQRREMRQQLLERQQEELKKESMTLRSNRKKRKKQKHA